MSHRIAFSGSAGTGKTTLARALAERLDVPYIEEGMRERVRAGLALYKMNDDQRRDLMRELWNEQREQELAAKEGFVSDRSAIDFAAFWLHYALNDAEEETQAFFDFMLEESRRVERVFLCPWGVLSLEDDGVRSTNPWLQLRYQALLEGLHGMHTDPAQLLSIPKTTSFDERISFALGNLS